MNRGNSEMPSLPQTLPKSSPSPPKIPLKPSPKPSQEPKNRPRGAQETKEASKRRPRVVQMRPRSAQEAPKSAQGAPKRSPTPSKMEPWRIIFRIFLFCFRFYIVSSFKVTLWGMFLWFVTDFYRLPKGLGRVWGVRSVRFFVFMSKAAIL